MKKFLFYLFFLALLVPRASHGTSFAIWARDFYPGAEFTGDCSLQTPVRKCCEDDTASSCNEIGCESNAHCTSGAYDTCITVQGDTGRRCCVDGSGTVCQATPTGNYAGKFCTTGGGQCGTNSDCTGNNIPWDCCSGSNAGTCDTYATCVAPFFAVSGGSELPGGKWECDPSNDPKLYTLKTVPGDLTNSSNQLSCQVHWNARGVSGNAVFRVRAIAVNNYASAAVPTLTGENWPSITDAAPTTTYLPAITTTGTFCIEDADTGSCCSGSACLNKPLKIELTVDATSTITTFPRIRMIYCSGV